MNRTLKFGYSYLGNHTLIKLNAKLNSSDIDYLKTSFPGLCFIHNQKGLTRIEGCLTTSEAYSFNSKLAYCLLEFISIYNTRHCHFNKVLIFDSLVTISIP